jgi:hypothetical protein
MPMLKFILLDGAPIWIARNPGRPREKRLAFTGLLDFINDVLG